MKIATGLVRSPYNYDVDQASDDAGLDCSKDKGRTQQSFAEEVDINTIARRFGLTGQMPENVPQILQGDFTEVVDFQDAMSLIVSARESFDAMPAAVRTRFDNDPGKFLDFTSNEDNYEEAIKFGLVRPEVVEALAAKKKREAKEEIDAAVEARMEASRKAAKQGG